MAGILAAPPVPGIVCASVLVLSTLRLGVCWARQSANDRRRKISNGVANGAVANGSNGYERIPQQEEHLDLYHDEDGTATVASMAAYQVHWQKIAVMAGAVTGFGVATTAAILLTLGPHEVPGMIDAWLMFLGWACLLVQAVYLTVEREPRRLHHQAGWIFWLIVTIFAAESLHGFPVFTDSYDQLRRALTAGRLTAIIAVLLGAIFLPRRPDVYYKGKQVDSARSVSLFSRYTFSWLGKLLKLALEKGHYDEADIPVVDRARRAEYLLDQFNEMKKSPHLWKSIFWAHWPAFVAQFFSTIAMTTVTYMPAMIMKKVLQVLETRQAGDDTGFEGYYWVLVLGATKMLESGLLSVVYWVCYAYVMIPVRSQLSGLVFQKTMNKKDVKGSQKEQEEVSAETAGDSAPEGKDGDEDDDNQLKNMKQGTINLLAVDSERVSLFACYANIFTESVVGAIYGFSWIYVVLGWQSLVAAISVILFTTPFNYYFSKRYADAQDELMSLRDKKMGVVSEALQGIRQIKFSALEKRWEQKIRDVRNEELATLRRVYIADVMVISAWIVNPTFLAACALSVHAIINGQLLPSVAFPALAIFHEMEWTLSIVPEMVADGLDAAISIKRIARYLDSASMDKHIKDSDKIAFTDATVAWAADDKDEAQADRFCLHNLNLEFPREELSVISGRTGSGKSLLLSSLLGESDLLSGSIEMPPAPGPAERADANAHPGNWILPSAVAYVAQIPWIENATLRDNILSGLPYIRQRYEKVLHACALEKDLESLTDGDMTEIGANGINLSGGQRWRVSFARAVYSRAGIVVLDDVFSAVDAHVGKHLFEHALTGSLMEGRTRILVTHHLRLCMSKVKYAVFLANGGVENAGSIEELQGRGVLERLVAVVEDGAAEAEEQIHEEELELVRTTTRDSVASATRRDHVQHSIDTDGQVQKPRQFVQDEERERGAVKMNIYKQYADASGGFFPWVIIVFLFALEEAIVLGKSYWVKMWTASYETSAAQPVSLLKLAHQGVQKFMTAVPEDTHNLRYWIGWFFVLNAVVCIYGTARYWFVYLRSLKASRVLFDRLVGVVLRAPMRWLDTVPIGRILNRFSKDFETIDSKLANDVGYLLWNGMSLLAIHVAAVYISPWLLLIALIGLAANWNYAYTYLGGAREVKRLESNSRSPIFELFGAALSGVATIRAFGRAEEYMQKMFERIDTYSQRTYFVWAFNRWVSIRMALIGSLFTAFVGILIVAVPSIDASMGGFALAFVLNYTGNVFWSLRRYANLELDMNSTERVVEYTEIAVEEQGGIEPPAAWPTDGRIEVENLHVSYAPELPPVLKGISFKVNPRERIGVVGRTGAGKSSLTLALFQFIRASQGTIFIDGLDISTLSLSTLRSRLAIIPQDPVLFSGTVRSNLDPFSEHTDEELKEALRRVHLLNPTDDADQNSNIFARMDSSISEGGLNLSQGQRQLLCLARAIVERPKILVMDEATSAVDMETDKLIQKSIREEFTDCTTLVIAHRLASVIDYDRILVLGAGEVREYGNPKELLERKGEFWELVQQTGEGEMLEETARQAAEGRV